MLKLRATTISKFTSEMGEPSVRGRFEISYRDNQWLNMGVNTYTETEWLMLVSLFILGARKLDNVTVEHVVLVETSEAEPTDCAKIE